MNFTKVIIFLSILTMSTFYISYTKRNYFYCTYANMYDDYLITGDKEAYISLCRSILQYSDHSLIQFILTFFYENKYYEISETSKNELKNWINSQNVYSLKLEIQIMKFCHILLYFLLLYFLLQVIPNFIFKIFVYMAQNIFQIVFLFLIFEAILNLYFGIRLDITKLFMIVKAAWDAYIWPIIK
jgi:hypothetical protein